MLYRSKKDVIIYSDHSNFYLISGKSLFTDLFLWDITVFCERGLDWYIRTADLFHIADGCQDI